MDFRTYWLTMPVAARNDFARRCGTSPGFLRNLVYDTRKTCGEKLAIAIERESAGAVRCETLRPDVDWSYLRGTAPVSVEEGVA